MQIKELKEQARALGRHLSKLGIELTHAQLLESLAAQHNAPDWNALAARAAGTAPKARATLDAPALLAQALRKGLTSGEAIAAFAERQSAREKLFASHAREYEAVDGELEFDDPGTLVSLSDGGAYVLGWKWVDLQQVHIEVSTLGQALELGAVPVCLQTAQGEYRPVSEDLSALPGGMPELDASRTVTVLEEDEVAPLLQSAGHDEDAAEDIARCSRILQVSLPSGTLSLLLEQRN